MVEPHLARERRGLKKARVQVLQIDNTVLVVIDVQGRLARIVHRSEFVIHTIRKLIRGAKVLDIPIVVTEQYPEGIGPTVPEIREVLGDIRPITKRTFSCCSIDEFMRQLKNRSQILIGGIETHVCVYQTVMDLLAKGYEVHLIADAVSSRREENAASAITRLRDEGAKVSNLEMALFELLQIAQGKRFKEILEIVK